MHQFSTHIKLLCYLAKKLVCIEDEKVLSCFSVFEKETHLACNKLEGKTETSSLLRKLHWKSG